MARSNHTEIIITAKGLGSSPLAGYLRTAVALSFASVAAEQTGCPFSPENIRNYDDVVVSLPNLLGHDDVSPNLPQ